MSSNGHKVAFKLMVGQEADAVVSVLAETHPEAVIQRYPAYISVESQQRLRVDIPRVVEALGSDYDVTRFLVILSSYVGTIDVQDDSVVLTA
ncbi:MAG: MmoB/DmpM family protein [Candidatus Binataceae bacterium]